MDYFRYKKGKLYCEDTSIEDIAKKTNTPVYIYSSHTIQEHFLKIKKAFASVSHLICYSIKANSALGILRILKKLGAGVDVVSGGELYRAIKAGFSPQKIVYAGVGKTDDEISFALKNNILLFNVESVSEIIRIKTVAKKMRKKVKIAFRINPDIDPYTHKYITTGKQDNKFGISVKESIQIASNKEVFSGNLELIGLHAHIGSQITDVEPYRKSAELLVQLSYLLQHMRHRIRYINIGGGFGIFYKGKEARSFQEFAQCILPAIKKTKSILILEPGRFIVGNAGILVTRVIYIKKGRQKIFAICDAGMSELIRPPLYNAYHRIWPVNSKGVTLTTIPDEKTFKGETYLTDIVGPICETGDYLGKDRRMPLVKEGELLAVFSAGAYGYTMASNYNSRLKPPQVLVKGKRFQIITRRESYEDMLRLEK